MMQLQIIPHHSNTHQAWCILVIYCVFGTPIFQKKTKTKKDLRSLAFIVDIQQSLSNLNLKKLGMYVFWGEGLGDLEELSVTYSGFLGDQYTGLGT